MTGFRSEAPSVGGSAGQVVFYDDFLGNSLRPEWVAMNRDSDQSNSELQWYLPANVVVQSSCCVITSQVQTQGPRSYTSAMIQWPTFNFLFGTVECRALMPGGVGLWPTIWLLGSDCQVSNISNPGNVGTCNWPNAGSEEIDIVEFTSTSTHLKVNQRSQSAAGTQAQLVSLSDASQNWHTYKTTWTTSAITWFVDSVQTFTTSIGVPQRSMYLMLNVAVGGLGGGTVTNSTLPTQMWVDYVKVTQG